THGLVCWFAYTPLQKHSSRETLSRIWPEEGQVLLQICHENLVNAWGRSLPLQKVCGSNLDVYSPHYAFPSKKV
ncbi:hypothetical protein BDZ89DRAFT_1064930, partial [Hymenopellis radicata]